MWNETDGNGSFKAKENIIEVLLKDRVRMLCLTQGYAATYRTINDVNGTNSHEDVRKMLMSIFL